MAMNIVLSFCLLSAVAFLKTRCNIESKRLLSKKDVMLSSSYRTMSAVSSIACVLECFTYSIGCVSISYSHSEAMCSLHDRHPDDNDVITMLASGYILYYQQKECELGWEKLGSKCYLFNSNSLSWEQAETYCDTMDAALVIVDDSTEHAFLQTNAINYGKPYYWIGARYYSVHGGYRWVDGTEITFDGWYPGQPDVTNGCVDMIDNYGWSWNDHSNCVSTYGGSICEKDL